MTSLQTKNAVYWKRYYLDSMNQTLWGGAGQEIVSFLYNFAISREFFHQVPVCRLIPLDIRGLNTDHTGETWVFSTSGPENCP